MKWTRYVLTRPVWLLLLTAVFLIACAQASQPPTATVPPPAATAAPEPTAPPAAPTARPEAEPIAARPLISEIQVGLPGNNNADFIEIHNAGDGLLDLTGWTVSYWLSADEAPEPLFVAEASTVVAANGYFLLVRAGEESNLNTTADATFEVGLFGKGSLILEDADGNFVDLVGWGDAPLGGFLTEAAAPPEAGSSLERLPADGTGNGQNSGNNAADFLLQSVPSPQNSGAASADSGLAVELVLPESVLPNVEFELTLVGRNDSGVSQAVTIMLPVPEPYTVAALPPEVTMLDGLVQWQPTIATGATAELTMLLQSPLTYSSTRWRGAYIEGEAAPRRYAAPQMLAVAGGSIPIATARELAGQRVTVEGVATMYTGGFFAGSTGVKFYIEDETGGVQIFVPDGNGVVDIEIGETVRVTGLVDIYRDALEVVPGNVPDDVEIVGAGEWSEPLPVSLTAVPNDHSLLGQLLIVEGTVTTFEEGNFDFQIELEDEEGRRALVLIEKDTGIVPETIAVGDRLQVTGISEFYSGQRQIKPRVTADLRLIFPPVLRLVQQGPITVQPDEPLEMELTVFNHTDVPMTNIAIELSLPPEAAVVAVGNDGEQLSSVLAWTINSLEANGDSATVSYMVQLPSRRGDQLVLPAATAIADQWPDAVTSASYVTFVGDGIPIWALQGEGERSPYVAETVTTEGVITAVFPELNGFWLQDPESDGSAATSDAIFVLTDGLAAEPVAGQRVQVTGVVREMSGQTTLDPNITTDIALLADGEPLPEPLRHEPPADEATALLYNEAREGMLVTVAETAVVVAPTTRFGEFAVLPLSLGQDQLRRTQPSGSLILVDDGSGVTHDDQTTQPIVVTVGDTVSGLVGPLAYSFGQFKIEPIQEVMVTAGERQFAPLPEWPTNQLAIATFNVENLFDTVTPHPISPPRPTNDQFNIKLAKLATAITAMGAPDIIALQEVENIETLVTLLLEEEIEAFGYTPYLIEGGDSRGIDVAYLVREERVTFDGVANYDAPNGITSRPPLVISATVNLPNGPQPLVLLNNHFTSLAGGEAATEPRRTAQAAWNVTLMEQIVAENPDTLFVVLGDLNSFRNTSPMETIEAFGLTHVYDLFADSGDVPYTYIFEGRTQSLDHILVSDALFERLVTVTTLPINAAYPLPLPEDESPFRVSDHDPLLAVFSLE